MLKIHICCHNFKVIKGKITVLNWDHAEAKVSWLKIGFSLTMLCKHFLFKESLKSKRAQPARICFLIKKFIHTLHYCRHTLHYCRHTLHYCRHTHINCQQRNSIYFSLLNWLNLQVTFKRTNLGKCKTLKMS